MKARINDFLHHLVVYDYILFGVAFALFILLIILAIVLRHKPTLAAFTILLAFLNLLLSPTLGFIELHKYLYATKVDVMEIKRLQFTPAIVVTGSFENISKMTFSTCKVKASAYKVAPDGVLLASLKNSLYPLKPLKKETIVIKESIAPKMIHRFKLIIEPFTYAKDYNVSVGVTCI